MKLPKLSTHCLNIWGGVGRRTKCPLRIFDDALSTETSVTSAPFFCWEGILKAGAGGVGAVGSARLGVEGCDVLKTSPPNKIWGTQKRI